MERRVGEFRMSLEELAQPMAVDLARIEKVFTAALEKEGVEERAEYLNAACSGDIDLLARVEALLAAHADAGSFLPLHDDEATAAFVPVSERPGTTIGRYKLLEQIGEGGFGVVFMADQERPVQRRVALKIIKAGMDTKQVVARFEAERQALAMMDHPNIAKVLDAGATDSGRPFFVMELVRGVPITTYCDEARLPTDERLVLFQLVCAAVQHAHQKGIIHRDLKPSNVLVTLHDDKAVPKVIDFGVAKAAQGRLTDRTLFTEFRQMIGTPTYMSPEQAQMSGLDVDTRSDIYSLGVLLYELLTGTTPINGKRFASATYDDLRRIICEEEPPRPSARLSTLTDEERTTLAHKRHCEPAQLAFSLRSDLDWIVMRCLEKDRTHRYQTANSLAQDVERYLNNEPIEARRPTRIYRLKKFVRRNKLGVLAGSAIALALFVGLTLAMGGFLRARQQTEIARGQAVRSEEVSRFLQDMLAATGPSVARGRDTTLLREILDDTAQRIAGDLNDQPAVKAELYFTLGTTYGGIGDYLTAVTMLEQAVGNYRRAFGNDSADTALALATLGLYQVRAGHPSLGKPKAKEGLDIALKSGNKLILAKCLVAYARSFDAAIATEESIPYIREAIAIVEELQTEPLYLSDLYGLLGIHLDAPEDAAESEELLRNALETSRKYYPPDHPEIVGDLYTFAQRLQANNKYEESRATVEEAYALALKIYPPEHYMPHRLAAMQLEILVYDEQWDEAEKVCQEIVAFAPDNAGPWTLYGHVLAKRGDVKGAIEKFKRAVEHSGDHPANWEGYWDLAIALLYDGRIEEYCTHCHEFLMRSAHTNEFGIAEVTAKAALMLPVQGPDFELACRLADFAGECTEPKWLLPWIQLTKSLADYRRDRFESAIDWAGRSANSKSAELECRAAALCVKACCYAQLGQFDLAEALLSESEAVRAEATDPASRRSIVWRDWTAVELIRHEAAERIEQASAIPQP